MVAFMIKNPIDPIKMLRIHNQIQICLELGCIREKLDFADSHVHEAWDMYIWWMRFFSPDWIDLVWQI